MEDQIYITIAKVLHGEANDAEHSELDAWLRADKSHPGIFAEMKTAWSEADILFASPHFNAVPAWEKVSARIQQPKSGGQKQGRTIGFPSWVKYSSAVAAILIIAFFIWNPFNPATVHIAAVDGNKMVTLPDNSIITLRKGSELSYPKIFASSERKVALKGEAYFEVARKEQQPFIVDAQTVSVRVLGTTFNVQCSERAADVTVTSGRVQVSAQNDASKKIVLGPGARAQYSDGTLSESKALGYEASWKSGELSFNDEPFNKVIEAIAAIKDTVIRFDAGMAATQQKQAVTVSFRNQTLEDMLTELCLITNSRWEKTGATYTILTK